MWLKGLSEIQDTVFRSDENTVCLVFDILKFSFNIVINAGKQLKFVKLLPKVSFEW